MSLLPLFPLNSVLFPNMPLKLHIFEERYKMMINECVDTNSPFGVVMIKQGSEAQGPVAEPYMVGCTAQITQVQKLAFGRMNLMAIGRDRFKINELDTSKPYLQADIEMMPLVPVSQFDLNRRVDRLRPLIQTYLKTLEDAGQIQFDEDQIPSDSQALAFLSAVILQTDNEEKQRILEAASLDNFITMLVKSYQREVKLLDILLSPPSHANDDSPFSLN